jgi:hypothetical protein
MRKLFLLALVLAACFSCFACLDLKSPRIPSESFDLNTKVVMQNGKPASITDLRSEIAASEKKTADLKVQLKQAVNDKISRDFKIAAIVFGVVCVGCLFLFFYVHSMVALKASGLCIAGMSLCLLAVKLVPYRTWIEIGIALVTAGVVSIYVMRHHNGLIKQLEADKLLLQKKIGV